MFGIEELGFGFGCAGAALCNGMFGIDELVFGCAGTELVSGLLGMDVLGLD